MISSMKRKIYNIIRDDDENQLFGNIFDATIISLISINVLLVVLDTFKMPPIYTKISYFIEVLSVVVFTIEYLLRIWTSDYIFNSHNQFLARIKYIFSFMALIDLFAILPFYIPFIISIDLRVLRVLRVIRLLRLLKMNRYTDALHTIGNVFKRKANQLLSSMFIVVLLMIIASVLMYHIENTAQPNVFNNALSGLWWAIATFTTVGYGDIFPITVAGKILSGIISILGIALVAVPTGIISAGFIEQSDIDINAESKQGTKKYCPYCGKDIEH